MARSSDSNFLLAILRDKTFQAREIRRVVMLTFVYLIITTALVGVFYHQMLGRLIDGMAPLLFVSEDMALANEALPTLSDVLGKWLIAMLLINATITIGLGVFITRRLGHPILAIKRSLREIGDGNLDVRLRASDKGEFGEIAGELTAAMRSVREQIQAAKSGIAQVGDLDASATNAESINHALQECRTALDYFQLERDAKGAAGDASAANDKAA
ncbi:HAMP domain-containing protein [Granulosicoccus sp. 3-233]|uniref:HAMP domain-containing protein n=1 Tax=Granulosicoccus sp. 3-233 TaxID=3417969 RepID=UPI003D336DDD